MNAFLRVVWIVSLIGVTPKASAGEAPCATCVRPAVYQRTCLVDESRPSWIFNRSTYSHDPMTGARVAQYMRTPPVEPLEDERNVTSRYRRIRTNLRGADGSVDSTYEVQAWGNGRGGLDAEWERVHDAWKESYLQNGHFNGPAWGGWNGPWGWGNGWGPGWNNNFPGGWNGSGNWGPGNWGPGNGPPGPWRNNSEPQGPNQGRPNVGNQSGP